MTKTTNYNLNQWDAGDRVLRTDFNADNAAIDTALAAKADTSALTALAESLSSTDADLAALATAMGTGGKNARIAWGTYTGTGTNGSSSPSSLTVDFYPVAVIIGSAKNVDSTTWPTILLRGCPKACSDFSSANTITVTWLDKGVRWYCADHSYGQDNDGGTVYYYCVIGCDNS